MQVETRWVMDEEREITSARVKGKKIKIGILLDRLKETLESHMVNSLRIPRDHSRYIILPLLNRVWEDKLSRHNACSH